MPADPSRPDGDPVTVLVVGTDDWVIEQAAENLTGSGSAIALRCTEPGAPAFPCLGVIDPDRCPLARGAEVVLAVRHRAAAEVTPREVGVVCGLHARIPVVIAGMSHDAPYDSLAAGTVGTEEDLATTCRSAVDRQRTGRVDA